MHWAEAGNNRPVSLSYSFESSISPASIHPNRPHYGARESRRPHAQLYPCRKTYSSGLGNTLDLTGDEFEAYGPELPASGIKAIYLIKRRSRYHIRCFAGENRFNTHF